MGRRELTRGAFGDVLSLRIFAFSASLRFDFNAEAAEDTEVRGEFEFGAQQPQPMHCLPAVNN